MGNKLVTFLMCINAITALVFLFQGNIWKGVYWIGATLINMAVINLK